jgi:hypothetical protein
MKTKIVSITAVLFFIALAIGCKKDPAGPKIVFKLKSLNATTFTKGQTVKFIFEFVPKTTSDDTLFVARKFFTCSGQAPDTLKQTLPAFDITNKSELIYSFAYNSGGPFNGCTQPVSKTDSLIYKFWVKDGDGNVSDTIVSPKVILVKP